MRNTLALLFASALTCACSPAIVMDSPTLVRSEVQCKSEVPVGSRRPQEVCTTAEERERASKRARATLENEQAARGEPIMRQ